MPGSAARVKLWWLSQSEDQNLDAAANGMEGNANAPVLYMALAEIRLMQRVKAVLDPPGIMNPVKVI